MSMTDAPVWLAHVAELVIPTIMRHEGLRLRVYRDTKGIRTIGYGCNLEAPEAKKVCYQAGVSYIGLMVGTDKLTEEQAKNILTLQVFGVIEDAMKLFPNFLEMPNNVKIVVCDMIFNLGAAGFREFVHLNAALNAGQWKVAASCMQHSLWYAQVGQRAKDDIALMEAA